MGAEEGKMRGKLTEGPAPLLAAVVKEPNLRQAAAAIRRAQLAGASVIDLHLSMLPRGEVTEQSLRRLMQGSALPILALQYNWDMEMQPLDFTEEERIEQLKTAVRAGAACIDLQGHTFSREDTRSSLRLPQAAVYSFAEAMPKEVSLDPEVIEKQTDYIRKIHALGAEVLLSVHTGVSMRCEQVLSMVRLLAERGPDLVKVVGLCDTDEELAEFCRTVLMLQKEVPQIRVSYHCNGTRGALTRLLGPLLGGWMMFCNESYTAVSDLNQLHLATMAEVWERLRRQGLV